MRLQRLRASSRLVACLLLLAWLGGGPHLISDDPACLPGAAEAYGDHDETQHQIRAGAAAAQEHCALCHWTRSLRSARQQVARGLSNAAPAGAVAATPRRAHRAPVLAHLPARAPPPLSSH